MARTIPVRTILRLGASGNAITRLQSILKTSAMDTFHAADEKGASWEGAERMSEREAYAPLFPGRVHDGSACPDPDWGRVHRELVRVDVTLKRLQVKHQDEAAVRG